MATIPAQHAPTDWYLLHARITWIDKINPPVWRQFFVPPTTTTHELHLLMQAAFQWRGNHIHMWSIREVKSIYDYCPSVRTDLNPGYSFPNMELAHPPVDHPRPDLPEDPPHIPETPEEERLAAEMAEHERVFGKFRFTEDGDYGLPPTETIGYLDGLYDFTRNKHVLVYEYDFKNSWKHRVTVEKRLAPMARVSGGSGHSIAEDVGGPEGWVELKHAYAVSGTQEDTRQFASRRTWFENQCRNGDRYGLKGQRSLERFNILKADQKYRVMLEEDAHEFDEQDYDDWE